LPSYDSRRSVVLVTMKGQLRLPGGDLEYAVLAKLWELGSASARDIHTQVGAPQRLVYTTIAKVLDRLHAKRLVSRERKGIAFVYRPRVARALVDNARARQLLTRLLGPAPNSPAATLVDAMESLNPKLLDELAEAIAARRRIKHGP
jgi:BlaI family transcriptional regulator, penicillinase repressor